MGLFDIVAGLGKAAGKALGDAATKQTFEAWEKVRNAPPTRLKDFYDHNNTQESNNAKKRALALAAMASKGMWEAGDLLSQDESARRALTKLRETVSLESSTSANTLRESIDRLLQR
ncbi:MULTISPECIES: hypothetical protein [Pseudomonas]|uniref:Uncharacterized protein n=1 Tax=Pseudomonas helleri TaxID=1608996 RepID=A0A6I1WX27_9PSED|nr:MULTISPECIES: hypothetical protein [Pseudomonas]MQU45213.1 hypothetical protein [Pseudomonas helleri]PAA02151.1 hypothetical protein CJU78_22265 [Pseudomonas fragi]